MRGWALSAIGVLFISGCVADPTLDDGHRFPTDEPEITGEKKTPPEKTSGSCIGAGCKSDDAPPSKPSQDSAPKSGATCEPVTCAQAEDLGTVSGDTPGDERSRQGSGSRFYTIRVTEDDENATGARLQLTATLVSPPGANYDIYLYADACGGQPVASSTRGAGTTDKAVFSWGEGTLPNFGDDDRTLLVEVRNTSSTCNPNEQWTLVVRGN